MGPLNPPGLPRNLCPAWKRKTVFPYFRGLGGIWPKLEPRCDGGLTNPALSRRHSGAEVIGRLRPLCQEARGCRCCLEAWGSARLAELGLERQEKGGAQAARTTVS